MKYSLVLRVIAAEYWCLPKLGELLYIGNCNAFTIMRRLSKSELTECNAFDRLLNSTSIASSMATKAITTMSTTTTAMTIVVTLEAPPPPPMCCAVVASGLLVVPRFVVAVVESPSVISGPGSSVAPVVTCSVRGVQ